MTTKTRTIFFLFALIGLGLAHDHAKAAQPRPLCYPLIKGTQAPILPKYVSGPYGKHLYYFCLDKTGQVVVEGVSCEREQCSDKIAGGVYAAVGNATGKVTAANSAWDKNVQYTCTDLVRAEETARGALCRERKEILDREWPEWSK